MKKVIISVLSLVFAGFLSAQTTTTKTTTDKNTNSTEQSTTTKTTTPVLKKKLVVVNASKVNQASGVVKENDKSKNTDKKEVDPSTKPEDGEPK